MKKTHIILASVIVLFSSCNTLVKTARTADTPTNLRTATVVDIVPATETRITHTLNPDASLQRGGEQNIRQAVEHEALVKFGNADILLEPQYIVQKERGLFRSKITSITVSGRPAYYTNYRTLHDSVWCNPSFNGLCTSHYSSCCHHSDLCDHPALDALKCLPYAGNHSHGGNSRGGFFESHQSTSSSTSAVTNAPTRGFTKGVSIFLGGEDEVFSLEAALNLGYQFNPYLEIGAGFGLDFYDFELDDIPLYGYARLNLSKREKHIFLDGKWGGDLYDMDALMGFSIGYCFGAFDLAFQYLNYSGENESYNGGYYGGYYATYSYSETEIGVTARFRF